MGAQGTLHGAEGRERSVRLVLIIRRSTVDRGEYLLRGGDTSPLGSVGGARQRLAASLFSSIE